MFISSTGVAVPTFTESFVYQRERETVKKIQTTKTYCFDWNFKTVLVFRLPWLAHGERFLLSFLNYLPNEYIEIQWILTITHQDQLTSVKKLKLMEKKLTERTLLNFPFYTYLWI